MVSKSRTSVLTVTKEWIKNSILTLSWCEWMLDAWGEGFHTKNKKKERKREREDINMAVCLAHFACSYILLL